MFFLAAMEQIEQRRLAQDAIHSLLQLMPQSPHRTLGGGVGAVILDAGEMLTEPRFVQAAAQYHQHFIDDDVLRRSGEGVAAVSARGPRRRYRPWRTLLRRPQADARAGRMGQTPTVGLVHHTRMIIDGN